MRDIGFGSGKLGAVTLSGTQSPIDSACSGTINTKLLSATNALFEAGQLVLIHQTIGNSSTAGLLEVNQIESYVSGTITLVYPLERSYAGQAQVVVLNEYSSVKVLASLSAKAWNGTVGGILAFLCSGQLQDNGNILGSGLGLRGGLGVAQAGGDGGEGIYGYVGDGAVTNSPAGSFVAGSPAGGGYSGNGETTYAAPGTSLDGTGGGGGGAARAGDPAGAGGGGGGGHLYGGGGGGGGRGDSASGNGGTGGLSNAETGGGGGGGAGFEGSGQAPNGANSGNGALGVSGHTSGGAGGTVGKTGGGGSGTSNITSGDRSGGGGGGGGGNYGIPDATTIHMGSGGGAGGGAVLGGGGEQAGGNGGDGGAIIFICARRITGTGTIKSDGENGYDGGGVKTGQGGGGGGGFIFLKCEEGDFRNLTVTCLQGNGSSVTKLGGQGGQGSPGRIRIETCRYYAPLLSNPTPSKVEGGFNFCGSLASIIE